MLIPQNFFMIISIKNSIKWEKLYVKFHKKLFKKHKQKRILAPYIGVIRMLSKSIKILYSEVYAPLVKRSKTMEIAESNNSQVPSFETVWAALQETDRIMKEHKAEFDREMRESNEKFEREMQERDKKWEEEQKEYKAHQKELNDNFYAQLGKHTNLFGQFTEAMLAPALGKKFMDFGFDFQTLSRNVEIKGKDHKTFLEVDVMLENGEKAMLVEIKTKLTIERINYHINRLEKMRVHADSRGDKRKFLGAVAGVIVTDPERAYALNQGLYLIETSGENLYITPPNGKPKEW
jgi:ribosomal protein L9